MQIVIAKDGNDDQRLGAAALFTTLRAPQGAPSLVAMHLALAGNYAPTLAQWDPCLQLLLPGASPTTLKHP